MPDEINPYETPSSGLATPSPSPVRTNNPQSPYGPYRNNRKIALTISFLLTIFIFSQIYYAILISDAIKLYEGGKPVLNFDSFEALASTEIKLRSFFLPLYALLIILWCVWTNRSCKNAWLFRVLTGRFQQPGTGGSFTPAAAVGWFFIPIASFWKPYQAMAFIRDSSESRGGKTMGALLGIWWTIWLLNTVDKPLTWGLAAWAGIARNLIELQRLEMFMMTIPIISALTAMLVILRLTSIQAARARDFGI